MYKIILLLSLVLNAFHFQAQSYQDSDILKPINLFIEGTSYNYPEKILESFLPGGQMFLYNDADTLMMVKIEVYASWYDNGRRGQRNQRFSNLLSLDIQGDVAYAKLQVDIPSYSKRYYDLLLLKKIEDDWKIISKCTDAIPLPLSPADAKPKPKKEIILENMAKPWSMAFVNEEEAIIAEKNGGLVYVDLRSGSSSQISGIPIDIATAVSIDSSKHTWGTFPPSSHNSSQRYNAGLFQILLDPNFADNKLIYLSYAAENEKKASALKIVRAKLQNKTLGELETIFVAGPYSHGLFHYGGGMVFGADEKLYITTGERNLYEENNPLLPLSQDPSDKRGKVFRINSDGTIPSDNPDFGPSAQDGLYATGIRASQGLAIHPESNEIWFSEHGTIQGDEINKLEFGANYGWPLRTSGSYRSQSYKPMSVNKVDFTDPIHFWDQTIAPTGLTFYYGRDFPQWHGNLIIPGLSKGSLWRLEVKNDNVVSAEELFIDDRLRLRKAIVSPRGVLYVLSDEENGKLIKITNEKRD